MQLQMKRRKILCLPLITIQTRDAISTWTKNTSSNMLLGRTTRHSYKKQSNSKCNWTTQQANEPIMTGSIGSVDQFCKLKMEPNQMMRVTRGHLFDLRPKDVPTIWKRWIQDTDAAMSLPSRFVFASPRNPKHSPQFHQGRALNWWVGVAFWVGEICMLCYDYSITPWTNCHRTPCRATSRMPRRTEQALVVPHAMPYLDPPPQSYSSVLLFHLLLYIT